MAALDAYRVAFGLYSAIGVLKTVVTFLLTDKCEAEPQDPASSEAIQPRSMNESEPLLPPHRRSTTPAFSISLPTRGFLLKFCPIIMFDNVGTGFSTDSWLTYFLNRKFPNISDGLLGSIFSTCSVIISISNILAIPAARRFGILHTMIMGHVIASTALMLLPLPDELNGAVMLLVTRAVFLDFDQAPRQTFLSQRLPADERTAAMGFVNMTRTLAQSGGPLLTGYLGQQGQLGFSFVLAGVVKLVYNILLAVVFLPESCKQ
ncbi:hypothetical protein ACN42_g4583 [Penicillium freii]|uniref:Major facilitator superfamily (MFS) profile domain-containing protein n=1 Tax=Penicillium freii TaxID=48697 RepID=A0A101ML06_PENFR|nr:hypothetical protein ACN42_g4583 [Penicillium freii]